MAEPLGTVELVARELARAFAPLRRRLTSGNVLGLLAELGLRFPAQLAANAAFTGALNTAATAAGELPVLVRQLVQAADNDDVAQLLQVSARIVENVGKLVPALDTIATQLDAVGPALPGMVAAEVQAFAAALPERLLHYVLLTYLEGYHPILFHSLQLLGIAERAPQAGGGDTTHPPHLLRRLRLDRVGMLLSSPEDLMRTLYGWGDPGFTGELLLVRLHTLLHAFAAPVDYVPARGAIPPQLDLLFFTLRPKTDIAPKGLELLAEETFPAAIDAEIPFFSPTWKVGAAIDASVTPGLSTWIQPPFTVTVHPPALQFESKLATWLRGSSPTGETRFRVFGTQDGTRLEAAEVKVGAFGVFRWNAASNTAVGDFGFEASIDEGRVVIALGGADGFLGAILPPEGFAFTFDVGVGYTGAHGLYFTGSAGLEIALALHVGLGPVNLETLYLALEAGAGGIDTEVSIAATAALGPLAAAVDRIGAIASLRFQRGNLGPVDLGFRFKPPNGIGLAVDAGVVKGGGYLYLDFDKGEYAGLLELTISDWLALKAIGLINTKLPGGAPGFSLLIIITAEFSPGFQLGYGFTLIGVGGLLGLNRAVLLDPLAQGVRTGAVNSILFPTNVVANATKILSDLRAIFPPEEGTFLIGPMAKIGWGTPTLISVSLGVIIEIPGNVVILGRLRVALPTDEEAVLILQVTFIGALEFDKRRLWFFASMYESRVLFITLQGEMGLLMDFSDNPNFVLSVGGFHPRFTAPPLPFPSPARIALIIVNESWARLWAETYFAVTTNSVQMGCRADAFFGFDAFSVEGYFSFDALLRFSPFYLIVEVSTGFSVKVFGVGVWGVHLRGSLEGPTPWRVRGSAEIEILFFSFDVDVDVTFGERRAETLPPIDVLPRMRAEFEKLESWRATPPPSGRLHVSLRELGSAGALVMHPVGTLQISQRFAPLNLRLDKVGHQKPADVKKVTVAVQAGALAVKGPTREKFAAAQYRDMSDAAKLSAPAYEPLDSGVELGAAGQPWATGPAAQRTVRYETIIVDSAFKQLRLRFFKFWDGLFVHFREGAAVSRATVSLAAERRLQPFATKVMVEDDRFTVAWQTDNRAYTGTATFGSFAEAQAHLDDAVRREPGLAKTIHVVPSTEATLAA